MLQYSLLTTAYNSASGKTNNSLQVEKLKLREPGAKAFASFLLIFLVFVVCPPRSLGQKPESRKGAAHGPLQDPTGEQVAEAVVYAYGSRPVLQQIRKNGFEHGRMTRASEDGHSEEITYDTRFIRGKSSEKDRVRVDQKSSSAEYALVYNDGQIWGVINGSAFVPRKETTADFLSERRHGLEALLRFKEDGAKIAFVKRDKQKSLDLYVIDMTDREGNRTRYYISTRHLRVLWLEYEEDGPAGKPVRFRREYHDYRVAQSTLVPYNSVLYADGKQVEDNRILTVQYGVKLEDSLFQNPESANSSPGS